MSDIKKVGVLGAGVMGSGIAQVAATAGYETVCYDVDGGALDAGREHVTTGRYGLERGVERGKLTRDQAEALINAPDVATLKGKRDRALLAVLIGCGLRRLLALFRSLSTSTSSGRREISLAMRRASSLLRRPPATAPSGWP